MNPFHALQRTDETGNARWVHFADPLRTVEVRELPQVLPALRELEAGAASGLHAVGWIAYEASAAFDPHLQTHSLPEGLPFLRFTVYREQKEGLPLLKSGDAPASEAPKTAGIIDLQPAVDAEAFRTAVSRIHNAIARGETYQVNYTYPLHGRYEGCPRELFRRLRQAQSASHQAYIEEDNRVILSTSPERFFKHQGNRILCKPMKGTAPPGQEALLRDSVKNRSENIMIVDMIRNDLGKIAEKGSVNASPLFEVERYPSLLQMTSTVRASGSGSPVDWLCALFPCASITGAPKRKTMEWIRRLEKEPRGIYTGCIGGFFGDGISEFNVAIRTAVMNTGSNQFLYHSGCGIVWDSDAQEEYAESRLKTAVLRHPVERFLLIETMRGEPANGIPLWSFHRQRLLRSAAELGFELDPERLDRDIARLRFPKAAKVRLTLSDAGKVDLQLSDLPASRDEMSFRIDSRPTPSQHPELKHKSTRRQIYREARERHPDVEETLLINEQGELTEFSIGNLVWVQDGQAFTPPLSCGLLAGVARADLLSRGELKENICRPEDLERAEKVWMINALRGRVNMRKV